jgi:hypothetical protein
MSTDDELRRRLSNAADRAGAGANPAAAAQAVAAKAAQGGHMGLRLLGGLGAAGLVAGAVLGITVLKPSASASPIVSGAEVTGLGLAGFDCPNGAIVASLNAGDRVFATGRNDDGSWLAIRDPQHTDRTLWVPAKAAKRDATTDLAVTPCDTTTPTGIQPTETGSTSTTTTVAETTTTPTTAAPATTTKATVPHTVPRTTTTPPTTAKPDTTKPTITSGHPNVNDPAVQLYGAKAINGCTKTWPLTVTATDNVGVTTVVGTWSTSSASESTSGTVTFTLSGGVWQGTFGPAGVTTLFPNTPVHINVAVKDAAGNTSTITLQVMLAGQCIG